MIFVKDYIDYKLRKNDILYRFIIFIVGESPRLPTPKKLFVITCSILNIFI